MASADQHQKQFESNQRIRGLQFMRSAMALIRNRVVKNLTGAVLFRRTGRLVNSIATKVQRSAAILHGSIGTNVWYGVMWETVGSKAHRVTAVHAKALKIPIGSKIAFRGGRVRETGTIAIFRKSAFIPRQAARPFIRPAIKETGPAVNQLHVRYFGNLFPREPIIVKLPVKL